MAAITSPVEVAYILEYQQEGLTAIYATKILEMSAWLRLQATKFPTGRLGLGLMQQQKDIRIKISIYGTDLLIYLQKKTPFFSKLLNLKSVASQHSGERV
jgi:hypothetical protein